jgi:RNA polymerase sigma-70 factor (ECF subfamily)
LDNRAAWFDNIIWPHARAALNFARWLVNNDHDAEDVVQESMLKATQAASSLRGADARPWLLAIVHNTAMNFVRRNRPALETPWSESAARHPDAAPDPEHKMISQSRRERVRTAIARLQPEFRDAIVLREIEGLAYKEIGYILKIPIGTVMSRLSRARVMLAQDLLAEGSEV